MCVTHSPHLQLHSRNACSVPCSNMRSRKHRAPSLHSKREKKHTHTPPICAGNTMFCAFVPCILLHRCHIPTTFTLRTRNEAIFPQRQKVHTQQRNAFTGTRTQQILGEIDKLISPRNVCIFCMYSQQEFEPSLPQYIQEQSLRLCYARLLVHCAKLTI